MNTHACAGVVRALVSFLLIAASGMAAAAIPGDLHLTLYASGLNDPVAIRSPMDGSGRMFVLERGGNIRVINAAGTLLPTPYYTRSVDTGDVERGLLGIAFDPSFASNGILYIVYTATGANGEILRPLAQGNAGEARQLLHSLAVVYWGAAGLIAVAIFLLAPFVAGYRLDSKSLAEGDVSRAVALIRLVIACRWPIVLYQGALAGAQRLTILSAINSAMVTLGSVGAVAILAFVSATVDAFFIWQACVGVVYAATIRSATWWILGKGADLRFDWGFFIDCPLQCKYNISTTQE